MVRSTPVALLNAKLVFSSGVVGHFVQLGELVSRGTAQLFIDIPTLLD